MVKNPLGDIAGVYKLGMFYFSKLNLGVHYNSSLNYIFLVAAAYSEDIKIYGINSILEPIVKEIKDLETYGLEIENEIYFASLYQNLGDNLGIHHVFNLKCCFTGENICHLCDASTESIQKKINHGSFQTKLKRDYDLALSQMLIDDSKILTLGIKGKCLLNDLRYFHTTKNYAFDLTHDLWEGIVPYELSIFFHDFIYVKKYFTMDFLNNRIKSFNYGKLESKNKPSLLTLNSNKWFKVKIKQKAAKMVCLFNHIPFLVGDKIPENDENWELYLLLARIIDILDFRSISLSQIAQLEWLIEEHHFLFKKLHPSSNLLKKHYNMVHYPNCIREIGNLGNNNKLPGDQGQPCNLQEIQPD